MKVELKHSINWSLRMLVILEGCMERLQCLSGYLRMNAARDGKRPEGKSVLHYEWTGLLSMGRTAPLIFYM